MWWLHNRCLCRFIWIFKIPVAPFHLFRRTQCVWGLQSNSTRLHHHTVLPVLGGRGRRVIWFAGLTGVEWLIRNPPHEQTQTGAEAAAAFFLHVAGQCYWLVFGTNSLTSSKCAGHQTDCEPSNSHGARILIMYWSRQLASSVHPLIKKANKTMLKHASNENITNGSCSINKLRLQKNWLRLC